MAVHLPPYKKHSPMHFGRLNRLSLEPEAGTLETNSADDPHIARHKLENLSYIFVVNCTDQGPLSPSESPF